MLDRETSIQKFRKLLNTYKIEFIRSIDKDKDAQDTNSLHRVLKSIDDLYTRVKAILMNPPDKLPRQDAAFEYVLFTDGGLEYIYKDPSIIDDFMHYLRSDLREMPFTCDDDLIDIYIKEGNIPPPTIVSNHQ